ncbi:GNAT family N-acetyltransferase [Nocardioides sp. C4-1]|uniref:GNAT family N-acetyltransferase n=1 Tax=Nocardioides sp. C4-1 TaxID=3151851 RepID=UPI0032634A99
MTVVRPFEPDDLPALWALAHLPDAGVTEDGSVPVPLPARRVAPTGPPDLVDPSGTVLAAGGTLLVAVDGDALVGVGGLRTVHDRPRLGRVIRLRVHPATRRRGIARGLMDALQDDARRRGLTDLLLDVGDHQPEALAFYRALGWSETWRESGPEWHWQTVWFHRSLERDHLAVEVRPCAGDADVEALQHVLPSASRAHPRRWAEQQAGTATYLLAWDGDAVVGHVHLLARSRHDDVVGALGATPEVESLAVVEHARGRGVGTALLGAAAGVARADGASSVGLVVDHDDPVVTLCRRLGWTVRPGLRPVVDGERAAYWTLSLPSAAT